MLWYSFAPSAKPRCRRIKVLFLFAGILALVTPLTGCTRTPDSISFEDLCGLSHEEFERMDEQSIVQWVQLKYGVSPTRSEDERDWGTRILYEWTADKRRWVANFQDGHLYLITITDLEENLSFGQVVESLGSPETVHKNMLFHPELYDYIVGLDYPTIGLSVYMETTSTKWLDKTASSVFLDEEMKVNFLHCYTPAPSMEEVISESFWGSSLMKRDLLRARTSWPGFGAWISFNLAPLTNP